MDIYHSRFLNVAINASLNSTAYPHILYHCCMCWFNVCIGSMTHYGKDGYSYFTKFHSPKYCKVNAQKSLKLSTHGHALETCFKSRYW